MQKEMLLEPCLWCNHAEGFICVDLNGNFKWWTQGYSLVSLTQSFLQKGTFGKPVLALFEFFFLNLVSTSSQYLRGVFQGVVVEKFTLQDIFPRVREVSAQTALSQPR